MGYSSGTGLAAPVSPPHLAATIRELCEPRPAQSMAYVTPRLALAGTNGDFEPVAEAPAIETFAGMELEIETDFRRKLAGLRRLRRSERPHALRAAREERALALLALKERQAVARHARHGARRLKTPAPK